jgi:hypothetical protein
MKITPDRKIEVNEDVEVSEAAMTLIGIVNDMTKPKEWQSLSDDEIIYMYNEPSSDAEMLEFAREFEAKLREKNEK